jgi:Glycogen recognition site of AMP-activated protein kinase
MVSDEHDEMIERIAARLRPLPEVDPAARARVLVAVAATRQRDREQRAATRRGRGIVRWASVSTLAAALVLSVLVLQRTGAPAARQAPAAGDALSAAVVGAPTSLAARDAGDASLQRIELVFRAPDARSVSLVGDFTGWDPSRAIMTRDSASGLWSVTMRVAPGRHVYAFLVDDSVWVRDPRAPSAPDADFGRPGSVLLVGRP